MSDRLTEIEGRTRADRGAMERTRNAGYIYPTEYSLIDREWLIARIRELEAHSVLVEIKMIQWRAACLDARRENKGLRAQAALDGAVVEAAAEYVALYDEMGSLSANAPDYYEQWDAVSNKSDTAWYVLRAALAARDAEVEG